MAERKIFLKIISEISKQGRIWNTEGMVVGDKKKLRSKNPPDFGG